MIRKYITSIAAAALLVGGAAVVFADSPAAEVSNVWEGAFTEEQAERGQQAYEVSCIGCHAATLRGTPGGPGIAGGRFTFNWNERSVGELLDYVIYNMPVGAANTLNHETYADIVAYILQVNEFPAGEVELDSDPAVSEGIVITRTAE